jgi:hypothetical protein
MGTRLRQQEGTITNSPILSNPVPRYRGVYKYIDNYSKIVYIYIDRNDDTVYKYIDCETVLNQ